MATHKHVPKYVPNMQAHSGADGPHKHTLARERGGGGLGGGRQNRQSMEGAVAFQPGREAPCPLPPGSTTPPHTTLCHTTTYHDRLVDGGILRVVLLGRHGRGSLPGCAQGRGRIKVPPVPATADLVDMVSQGWCPTVLLDPARRPLHLVLTPSYFLCVCALCSSTVLHTIR